MSLTKYKNLVINVFDNDNKKTTSSVIKCHDNADDNVLIDIANILKDIIAGEIKVDINYINKSIVETVTPSPITPPAPVIPPYVPEKPKDPITTGKDTLITIPKLEDTFVITGFTDEDFYGANLDGANRKYRLLYVDNNVEKFVPLEGFEPEDTTIPHHWYRYNSDGKRLEFALFKPTSTNYILRKMF